MTSVSFTLQRRVGGSPYLIHQASSWLMAAGMHVYFSCGSCMRVTCFTFSRLSELHKQHRHIQILNANEMASATRGRQQIYVGVEVWFQSWSTSSTLFQLRRRRAKAKWRGNNTGPGIHTAEGERALLVLDLYILCKTVHRCCVLIFMTSKKHCLNGKFCFQVSEQM